jgi:NADH-quinone oxidoreductase subunit C
MIPTAEEGRLDVAKLRNRFPQGFVSTKIAAGETYVCLDKNVLVEAATLLRDDPELAYDYFSECLGVDYSVWEHERDLPNRFEIVYNLMSVKHSSRLFLKVGVDDGDAVPTLKEVYLGAEYPEKEIGDLYGIKFAGNELEVGERFLMPDDWKGFPLRKEYPLGGDDVLFDGGDLGPAVEDVSRPHAGESFQGKTGSEDVGGR